MPSQAHQNQTLERHREVGCDDLAKTTRDPDDTPGSLQIVSQSQYGFSSCTKAKPSSASCRDPAQSSLLHAVALEAFILGRSFSAEPGTIESLAQWVQSWNARRGTFLPSVAISETMQQRPNSSQPGAMQVSVDESGVRRGSKVRVLRRLGPMLDDKSLNLACNAGSSFC